MAIRAKRERGEETGGLALRYWRAVAELPVDRPAGLAELEACFGQGSLPEGMDGPYRGRLLATTFGYGLDPLFAGISRAWMPWKGKTFNARESTGRNIFTGSFRPLLRAMWPGYRDELPDVGSRFTTFRFDTHVGPSKLDPRVEVLRIDYDTPQDPSFLIRRILDELVRVGDGLYLGQALLRVGEGWKRACWFSLEG